MMPPYGKTLLSNNYTEQKYFTYAKKEYFTLEEHIISKKRFYNRKIKCPVMMSKLYYSKFCNSFAFFYLSEK